MELSIVSWIVNGLLGVVMFFMKQASHQQKADIDRIRSDLDKVRESAMTKDSFREFKEELWHRLDKFEARVDQRLEKL